MLRDALDEFLAGKTGRRLHYRILKIILFGSHAKGTWVNDPANATGQLTPEEQKEVAQKHYNHWLESTTQIFCFSQQAIENQWLNQAAFQLNQATERYFSCTLLVCTNYLPKTHNLKHLRSLCA